MKRILTIAFPMILGLSFTQLSAQCTAGFTFNVDPANNGDVTYTNTSSTGTGLFYSWNFGDGTYDNAVNPPSHNYPSGGTFNVCLTIYDSTGLADTSGMFGGCYNTFCSNITVINSSATCSAMFYAYSDTASSGVYFSNTSSGFITDYLWDFGDGTTSTLANPGPHIYPGGGFYTVCLTTNNPATLCNSTYCDTVFYSSCTTTFTYTPDATGDGCTFNGSSTGTAITYSWNFGDGSSSTLQNPYHVFAANGSYNICLTASSSTDSTCNSMSCQYVTLTGICDANFSIIQDSFDLYNYFIYNYSAGGTGSTYFWDFGDGGTSTLIYPTHTYTGSGPYLICLTVSDGACSDTYCDSIYPGHSSSTNTTVTVLDPLGVNENANIINSLENYPNPFSSNTTISYSINKDASVELSILDLLGNKVAAIEAGNRSSGSYKVNWNSEGVADGMYLLQLKVNNMVSTKKLMINK
jgi:PKD repeat protein